MKELIVQIKPNVIIWAIGLVLGLMLLVALRDLVVILLLAFIVSSGFRPVVDKLSSFNVPRVLSLILIYLSAILLILVILLLTIDTFITQFNNINENLPSITENILNSISNIAPNEWGVFSDSDISEIVQEVETTTSVDARTLHDVLEFFGNNLGSISNTGLSLLSSVTTLLFSLFLVMIIAAYLIARPEKAYKGLVKYIPKKSQDIVMHLFDKVEQQLGTWVVGQLILMLVIGFLTYIALMAPYFLGVEGYELHKFALLLAIIAGFFEAFPNIGPTLTLLLTVIMAIGTGGSFGVILFIFLAFTSIQQLENIFITPMIIGKAVNLDPIVIIVAIAAGLQLGGVLGAILSIPITVIIRIILDEMNNKRIEIEESGNIKVPEKKAEQTRVEIITSKIDNVRNLIRKLF